ncbi:queuosine salvage protein [Vigna radiata var. radiata]|uniref:Queuosine 5'-phosphate N-glycosylase/hydrolase n=1 Tax=Vigna radiata var. radiata TaxID=3916 RepID=A0A1S3VMA2_VIGRR|nr:queuosine salvage protein [Vigna radiata var. radiata]
METLSSVYLKCGVSWPKNFLTNAKQSKKSGSGSDSGRQHAQGKPPLYFAIKTRETSKQGSLQTPHSAPQLHSAMEDVRATSAWVASRSSHVLVDSAGIEKVVSTIESIPKVEWDFEGIHYFDNGPLTVQYLFVLDALNFCFWPDKDLNYDDLASGLKAALQNDKSAFDADRLQNYTGPQLRELLRWPRPLPLEDERVRLLHEVGIELERNFEGKASNLVQCCGKSAVNLVALVARHFPGFRDHTVYKGRQVFLYKRAQIFAADLWGAFGGQGYGEFKDVGSLTIMADYIVPAVLRQLGVLKYSSALASTIESSGEIGPGTEEEVELRACSVHAVEKMRELISKKSGRQVLSVELDLWLWAAGVQCTSLQHHRTLSIYY